MEVNVVLVNPGDNVAVAIREIKAGEAIVGAGVGKAAALEDVPRNHKVSLRKISAGERVIKYGEPIGVAGEDLEPGRWVHTHNVKSEEG